MDLENIDESQMNQGEEEAEVGGAEEPDQNTGGPDDGDQAEAANDNEDVNESENVEKSSESKNIAQVEVTDEGAAGDNADDANINLESKSSEQDLNPEASNDNYVNDNDNVAEPGQVTAATEVQENQDVSEVNKIDNNIEDAPRRIPSYDRPVPLVEEGDDKFDLAELIRNMVEDEMREIRRPDSVSSYLSLNSPLNNKNQMNTMSSLDLSLNTTKGDQMFNQSKSESSSKAPEANTSNTEAVASDDTAVNVESESGPAPAQDSEDAAADDDLSEKKDTVKDVVTETEGEPVTTSNTNEVDIPVTTTSENVNPIDESNSGPQSQAQDLIQDDEADETGSKTGDINQDQSEFDDGTNLEQTDDTLIGGKSSEDRGEKSSKTSSQSESKSNINNSSMAVTNVNSISSVSGGAGPASGTNVTAKSKAKSKAKAKPKAGGPAAKKGPMSVTSTKSVKESGGSSGTGAGAGAGSDGAGGNTNNQVLNRDGTIGDLGSANNMSINGIGGRTGSDSAVTGENGTAGSGTQEEGGTEGGGKGSGSSAKDGGGEGGNKGSASFDPEAVKDLIQTIVRDTWQNEVTVESKNEKQLLDILRLRDNEVIKAHERVAEVSGLLVAADKTLEAMRAQIKEIEHEKEDLQNRMIAARVTEQKATTIVDVNTKRSADLSRDLEGEKKRRNEERIRLQGEVAQAKEDHRVEVMAYRRALSTEEAKVVMLQQELKESRERIAELQRQNASGPIQMVTSQMMSGGGGSGFSPNGSGGAGGRGGKFGKGGGSLGKKKLKSIENIYSPLSSSNVPLPKIGKK